LLFVYYQKNIQLALADAFLIDCTQK